MSTVKSNADHLTLNADGASKDIKFQTNGVEKASISSTGNLTCTGIDDNATSTAITISSAENASFTQSLNVAGPIPAHLTSKGVFQHDGAHLSQPLSCRSFVLVYDDLVHF